MQVNVIKRKAGRPRVGDCRIETIVPQSVLDALLREEARTGQYRTRVAANVLCTWAKKATAVVG